MCVCVCERERERGTVERDRDRQTEEGGWRLRHAEQPYEALSSWFCCSIIESKYVLNSIPYYCVTKKS